MAASPLSPETIAFLNVACSREPAGTATVWPKSKLTDGAEVEEVEAEHCFADSAADRCAERRQAPWRRLRLALPACLDAQLL